ncbi:hypothetical protein MA16_Dca022246 [Dendrobium catenatum]|uniref:Uncharacterized protein n=1 Tax=Dendrobium catenatum TaxID=906689 RepID=A0A2I0WH54_9ASPA|nr:hypothetical protein MA16_Dca022246 [Dendrobium catenatum]
MRPSASDGIPLSLSTRALSLSLIPISTSLQRRFSLPADRKKRLELADRESSCVVV